MSSTENTAPYPLDYLIEFDIRCARQGIESAARSIASLSTQLAVMAEQADDPTNLAHYASVISKDALALSALAEYAKGLGVALIRMKGEV